MEQPERMLGHVVGLDIPKRRVTIEVDFFDPDKQDILENFLKSRDTFSFSFWKPFKASKTHAQLKCYFRWVHIILQKLGIYPDACAVKAFDYEIKTKVFPCESLEIHGDRLPMPKSKAVYSKEEMDYVLRWVKDTYGIILDTEEN